MAKQIAFPWIQEQPDIVNPVRNTQHQYLKFVNSRVFSEEAIHFLKTGYYTNSPMGSKDYVEYWDEQEKRCLEGYTVGGVRITGRHYFFLNFTLIQARPIDLNTGKESETRKILTFPRFLDHQYYLFHEFEECFAEGDYLNDPMHGICILKSRRKGISYVNAGGIYAYNFNFIPHSNSVIATYMTDHYKAILNGVHFAINHVNKHTDWAKHRQKLNKREHFRASFTYKTDFGMEAEAGFMSEIQAKSFKDDPFKAIGESVSVIGWEECGHFSGLLDSYTITEPTIRDGNIFTGVNIFWGTGGDIEKGGRDLETIFYNPEAYGCKPFNNIYDDNATGNCGWFIDDLWYLPGEYFDSKTKKSSIMVDMNGNSIRTVAKNEVLKKRELKVKGSRAAYRKFITQQPLTPSEALLRISGTIFDTLRAEDRRTQILSDKAKYIDSIYLVKLRMNAETSIVSQEPDDEHIPLRDYPIKDWDRIEGCIEIYEPPVKNNTGEITSGRYIAGIDSYDDDQSSGTSLGSMLLLDKITDRIVCHYKGRPMAHKFYENCRLILKYYNARANYERRNKGIYAYFYNKHCLQLLCEEPDILRERGISKANTFGNNAYGTAPSTPVNNFGLECFMQYLAAVAYGEDPETSEVCNMDKLRSIALLSEILAWNPDGNFDDISAAIMLMIYRENMVTIRVTEDPRVPSVMNDPYWKRALGSQSGLFSYRGVNNRGTNVVRHPF